MDKKCLFIDDEPDEVKSVLENLRDKGKLKGLNMDCQLLELTRKYYDGKGDLDRESIKVSLHNDFMANHTYDLVAIDFDLEDDHLTGLDIVKIVREKNRNCAVILYSGNLNKIADHISKIPEQSERFRQIKTIVNCKIAGFIDRSAGYEDDLIHILKKQIRLELTIEKKLQEHGDLKFKHGYDRFLGKSLQEIGHEIGIESFHGNKFTQEIIERGIAHMIELNSPE